MIGGVYIYREIAERSSQPRLEKSRVEARGSIVVEQVEYKSGGSWWSYPTS